MKRSNGSNGNGHARPAEGLGALGQYLALIDPARKDPPTEEQLEALKRGLAEQLAGEGRQSPSREEIDALFGKESVSDEMLFAWLRGGANPAEAVAPPRPTRQPPLAAPPSPNGSNGADPSPNGANGAPLVPFVAPAPAPPPESPAPRRAKGGRFAKGNPGGPGNPFARRVAGLRAALLDVVTVERLQALATKLYDLALGGDVAAAKLILCYAIGKPTDVVDPDLLDHQEFKLLDAAEPRGSPPGDCLRRGPGPGERDGARVAGGGRLGGGAPQNYQQSPCCREVGSHREVHHRSAPASGPAQAPALKTAFPLLPARNPMTSTLEAPPAAALDFPPPPEPVAVAAAPAPVSTDWKPRDAGVEFVIRGPERRCTATFSRPALVPGLAPRKECDEALAAAHGAVAARLATDEAALRYGRLKQQSGEAESALSLLRARITEAEAQHHRLSLEAPAGLAGKLQKIDAALDKLRPECTVGGRGGRPARPAGARSPRAGRRRVEDARRRRVRRLDRRPQRGPQAASWANWPRPRHPSCRCWPPRTRPCDNPRCAPA